MEYDYLLHGFVGSDGALQMWAERVADHTVIMSAADLADGDLPAELLNILRGKPFRNRGDIAVATPKGHLKQLPVPTALVAERKMLAVLHRIKTQCCNDSAPQNADSDTVDAHTHPGVARDLAFLINLYDYVLSCVTTGRVMLRFDRDGEGWVPRWTLSTAGKHLAVLQKFEESAPGVLKMNAGGRTIADIADDWANVMARVMVQPLVESAELTSTLMGAVADGRALNKAKADTVASLNDWRNEARESATTLVLRLSEPDEAVYEREDNPHWRVEFMISESDGPLRPVTSADSELQAAKKGIRRIGAPHAGLKPIESKLRPVQEWLRTGAWFPDKTLATGNPAKDRIIAMSLDLEEVDYLLSSGVKQLEKINVSVLIPRGWAPAKTEVKNVLTPVGQGPGSGKLGLDQMLEFSWEGAIGGHAVSESDMQRLVSSTHSIVEINGQFVYADSTALTRARQWLRLIKDATGSDSDDDVTKVSLGEVLEADAEAGEVSSAEDTDHDFRVLTGGWVDQLLGGGEIQPVRQIDLPAALHTPLRDHQRRGVNWLAWMATHGLGCILADDMGLGKTLQVLTVIAWDKEQAIGTEDATPALVVAPTSVLSAWQKEAEEHFVGLNVLVDHGARKAPDAEFADAARVVDVVVTSYGTAARNPERYGQLTWSRVIADEAQNIKNPATKQSRAVRGIPAYHHIAMTGTPIENRLSDLYAIMDFANPGMLGSPAAFQNRLAIPIERYQDEEAQSRLKKLVEPFILRRLKTDPTVGMELPEKREHVELVPLSAEQAALYAAYVRSIESALEDKSAKRRGIILGSLVKIKQICNHPAHFANDGSGILVDGKHRSPKVERVFDIVQGALAEQKKVLLFTQFPSFGRMLIPAMEREFGETIPMLDGSLTRKERQELVADFQTPGGAKIMFLSVRAGGTGITLTQASVVIHIDRWWNPAVEDQATDRAYRIGQDKDVEVYKLVSEGTLDERIHEIITGKRELAGSVVGGGEGWIANLDDADLAELWHLRGASDVSAASDTYEVNQKIGSADAGE